MTGVTRCAIIGRSAKKVDSASGGRPIRWKTRASPKEMVLLDPVVGVSDIIVAGKDLELE